MKYRTIPQSWISIPVNEGLICFATVRSKRIFSFSFYSFEYG